MNFIFVFRNGKHNIINLLSCYLYEILILNKIDVEFNLKYIVFFRGI